MPTWSDEYIARLEIEAEKEIARQTMYSWDRMSLAITEGTANYVLPIYVRGIISIQWKGDKVYPLHQREAIRFDPAYITTRGKVEWYLRSPEDFQYIRFIKVPNEDITSSSDDDLTNSAVLVNRVVITFYREPDVTQEIISIPDYAGRRLIRDWVLYKAYASEGLGQDLKASAYYKKTYEIKLRRYKLLLERYHQSKIPVSDARDHFNQYDMPRLQRGFNITPGPYPMHQGMPDSVNNFTDDIQVVLS